MTLVDQYHFQKIIKYLRKDYCHEDILHLLKKKYDIKISLRTLSRIVKETGLRRKSIVESSAEEITLAILSELQGSGYNLGYRSMWKRLRSQYNLQVKQKTVLYYLNIIDPKGVEARSRYKLKRRVYEVPGPNFLWHADNHDKLKRYGFPMYSCIDGFSRKSIFIHLARSNNNPNYIASYYAQAVNKYQCLPTMMRVDHGTEATTMRDMHMTLRYDHPDELSGEKSFLIGKSTHNQRIESFWKHFRERVEDFYIYLFKNMEKENLLSIDNPVHIELMRYCFGALIEKEIQVTRKEWNEHRLRNQKNVISLGGIPNELFNNPKKFGAKDYRKPVDLDNLALLQEEFITDTPYLVDPDFKEVTDRILPNVSPPTCAEEAYNMYCKVLKIF